MRVLLVALLAAISYAQTDYAGVVPDKALTVKLWEALPLTEDEAKGKKCFWQQVTGNLLFGERRTKVKSPGAKGDLEPVDWRQCYYYAASFEEAIAFCEQLRSEERPPTQCFAVTQLEWKESKGKEVGMDINSSGFDSVEQAICRRACLIQNDGGRPWELRFGISSETGFGDLVRADSDKQKTPVTSYVYRCPKKEKKDAKLAEAQKRQAGRQEAILLKKLEEKAAKDAQEARLFQEFQKAGNIEFGLTKARYVGGCEFQLVPHQERVGRSLLSETPAFALGAPIMHTHKGELKNCNMFYTDKTVAERMCYATKNCHAISTGCVDGIGGSCQDSFNLRVKCGFVMNNNNDNIVASASITNTPDVWGLYEKYKDGDKPSYITGKQTYQMVCAGKPKPHIFENCDSDELAGPPSCLQSTYVVRPGDGWEPECTRYASYNKQSCTSNHYMLNCCSVTCETCGIGKKGLVVAVDPNGDKCAKFHGKGAKCKKLKACKWVGKVDWDREGKCLPAESANIVETTNIVAKILQKEPILDPNEDKCAKFHGKGAKCKKLKACKWVGKVDWDREGKCLPADGSEISVAYDASDEKKVGIRKSDAKVFKVSVFLFCLLSITIFVRKSVHPKEAITYKELSQALAEI